MSCVPPSLRLLPFRPLPPSQAAAAPQCLHAPAARQQQPTQHTLSVALPLRPRIHTLSSPFNASSLAPAPLPSFRHPRLWLVFRRLAPLPPLGAPTHGASAPAHMQFSLRGFLCCTVFALLFFPGLALAAALPPVTYTPRVAACLARNRHVQGLGSSVQQGSQQATPHHQLLHRPVCCHLLLLLLLPHFHLRLPRCRLLLLPCRCLRRRRCCPARCQRGGSSPPPTPDSRRQGTGGPHSLAQKRDTAAP